ncbi:LysR family transcriptional regulator [Microvirga sp. W0021]|uniref:LysR family transcriptional regulator n=1 Tax=Hohaiivirga grylli TaxID=3133970 RepID=A0ABV0BH34_9HYPH
MDRLDCDRMFVKVMETGSFSKAAEQSRVSPSQASKLISKLESDLGVQLLKRTTRSLTATEVGTAYFERIKAILEDIDSLDSSVQNSSGTAKGRLRLSVPLSFGTIRLAPVFIQFAQAYPEIELDISFSDRNVNLVEEGYDAAIRIGRIDDSSLIARKLCDFKTITVASTHYLEQAGTPMHPDALISHECIMDTNLSDPALWRFNNPDTRLPIAIRVSGRLRFANAEICLDAAAKDFGITRVPSFFPKADLESKGLKIILEAYERDPYAAHIIYPAGRYLAGKTRAMVDFMAKTFHQERF